MNMNKPYYFVKIRLSDGTWAKVNSFVSYRNAQAHALDLAERYNVEVEIE